MVYVSNNTRYLLSGTLLAGKGPKVTNLTVYKLDSTTWESEYTYVINSDSLSLVGDLELNDFVVDSQEFIYICGSSASLKLKFNEVDLVTNVTRFTENDGKAMMKIAVAYTKEGKSVVQVATSAFILEIDWTADPNIEKYYEVAPNIQNIADLQFNSRMTMLEADGKYYFYRRGDSPRLKYLLSVNDSRRTTCLLDQATPSTIILNDTHSLSYSLSNGYLRILNPASNQNITVVAHSLGVSCSLGLSIKVVNDSSTPLVVSELENSQYESTMFKVIKLDEYTAGSRLSFNVAVTGANYSVRHTENISIVLDGEGRYGYEIFDTYPAGISSFYRFSARGNLLVDYCNVTDATGARILCRKYLNLSLSSALMNHTFYSPYKVLESMKENQTLIMAYVLEGANDTVNFLDISLGNNDTSAMPSLRLPQPISDVDVNTFFVVATCADGVIYIYRVPPGFGEPQFVQSISSIESPKEVIFSMSDPNILFVRAAKAISILRVTSGSIAYLSKISLPEELASSGREYRVVVNDYNLLLLWENSTALLEYSIMDIYDPTLLREISLMGLRVDSPLQVFLPEFNSDFVSVRTSSGTVTVNESGVSVIRMSVSAVNSYYAYFPTKYAGKFAGFDYLQSTALELGGDCRRLYYSPTVQVSSQNTQDRILLVSLNISVQSVGGPPVILSSNISLSNFLLPLRSTSALAKQYSTEIKDRKNEQLSIDTGDDVEGQLFEGSISSLSFVTPPEFLSCEQHGHFREDIEVQTRGLGAVKKLMSLNEGTILYVLLETGSISVFRVLDHEVEAASAADSAEDSSLSCSNWAYNSMSVAVHCSNPANGDSQKIIWYNVSENYTYLTRIKTIDVDRMSSVGDAQKMVMESHGGFAWIFILDGAVGSIMVIRLRTDLLTLQYKRIIDSSDFGASKNSKIYDMEIEDIPDKPNLKHLIVTVGDTGLGVALLNISGEDLAFKLDSLVRFRDNPQVSNYELTDSKYQQIEVLHLTPHLTGYDLVVTTSHGHHLQVRLGFTEKFAFEGYNLTGVYRKYGALSTMNWAASIAQEDDPQSLRSLILSYNDSLRGAPILTLQKVGAGGDLAYSEIRGVLPLNLPAEMSTSSVPPCVLFRHSGSNLLAIVLSSRSFTLFNVTQQLGFRCQYVAEQRTYKLRTSLNVTARNQKTQAVNRIDIEVQVDYANAYETAPWYLMAGMAGAFALSLVVGYLCIRARRNRQPQHDHTEPAARESLIHQKRAFEAPRLKEKSISKSSSASVFAE